MSIKKLMNPFEVGELVVLKTTRELWQVKRVEEEYCIVQRGRHFGCASLHEIVPTLKKPPKWLCWLLFVSIIVWGHIVQRRRH